MENGHPVHSPERFPVPLRSLPQELPTEIRRGEDDFDLNPSLPTLAWSHRDLAIYKINPSNFVQTPSEDAGELLLVIDPSNLSGHARERDFLFRLRGH